MGDLSFEVNEGETVGIVGESGSGKSVTALALLNLISPPGEIRAESQIVFFGEDILRADTKTLRKIRGGQIGIIFQNPAASFNPVLTIGSQIDETLRAHRPVSRNEARKTSIDTLSKVGLPHPETVYSSFPHSLSGGMQQRAAIAMAIVANPQLLIADEPTTALDVTVQAQIIQLLRDLTDASETALIIISHDLGVINQIADRTIVLHRGQLVEDAPTRQLIEQPHHPQSALLVQAAPTTAPKFGETS